MIPQQTPPNMDSSTRRTIHVNPNFASQQLLSYLTPRSPTYATTETQTATAAHINPNFLQGQNQRVPAIHMNPNFIKKKLIEEEIKQQKQALLQAHNTLIKLENQQKALATTTTTSSVTHTPERVLISANTHTMLIPNRKIISQTRTRLVREPAPESTTINSTYTIAPTNISIVQPLVSLSKRKLVRLAGIDNAIKVDSNALNTKRAAVTAAMCISAASRYKIDKRSTISNTIPKPQTTLSRRKFIAAHYKTQRMENLQIIKSKQRKLFGVTKTIFKHTSLPKNRTFKLHNINGILYKSTGNKLTRNDIKTVSPANSLDSNVIIRNSKEIPSVPKQLQYKRHTLFIKGTKYIMDSKGVKLTRLPSTNSVPSCSPDVNKLLPSTSLTKQRSRIDIGGLTYVASNKNNIFVRTRSHLAMAHVTTARQRSLHFLYNPLVKSNIPCAIYQRIGKCLAFERGKCRKVHDKRQVTICTRFLRGVCQNSNNCLLSHNVSLAKMPVCKFFLQGVCVRDDCPYLHKKLSQRTEICEQFLHGYCQLAEKCNKRHEFLCPEYERNGICALKNCVHCKSKKKEDTATLKKTEEAVLEQKKKQKDKNEDEITVKINKDVEPLSQRYFDKKQLIKVIEANLRKEDATKNDEQVLTVETLSPSNAENNIEEATDTTTPTSFKRRPKMGVLPAFIPIS